MAQKTVVIKKYENRRLYDSTNSRYVNLEEVAQLLQQGNDVQVIDASSGEDITRLILTQIIVEDAKTPESSFPLDLSAPNGSCVRSSKPGECIAVHEVDARDLSKCLSCDAQSFEPF